MRTFKRRKKKPIKTYHYLGVKPYNKFSKSYKSLRTSMNLMKYRPHHKYKVLVNWGSQRNDDNAEVVLNKEENIRNASSKIKTFKLLEDSEIVRIPKWTTDIDKAREFEFPVMCRRDGLMKGRGIVIAQDEDELVQADFYTEYIKPINEFRVHVFKDKVLGWSKKVPKDEFSDTFIRNHDKGYLFSLGDPERIYSALKRQCIEAVKLLGLDFGAVDVLLAENKRRFYVLEVNTAVGVEGTTLNNYVKAFKEYARGY